MLAPSGGGLILYQAYGNYYAMLGRKAHLLEDKQIPSVGVFDEVISYLLHGTGKLLAGSSSLFFCDIRRLATLVGSSSTALFHLSFVLSTSLGGLVHRKFARLRHLILVTAVVFYAFRKRNFGAELCVNHCWRNDEECLTSGSEDEEYAMAVRDFKKFFKRRGRLDNHEMTKRRSKEVEITRMAKVIENVLDAVIQIILLKNVQNHRKTRTKEHS
ncbi:hypothetical protein Tco_1506908 [Tanacetum coccineum]